MSSIKYVQEDIEIASVGYRIIHHLNLMLFTILAITGSLLLFPSVFEVFAYIIGVPLASLLGTPPVSTGLELARTSHRFLGVLWGIALVVYGLRLLLFGGVTVFRPLKKPIGQQIREAKAIVDHYLFGKPIPRNVAENLDRHNVLVSYMTLLLVIGIALISTSGVFLLFREMLDLQTLRLMLLLHDLGFYISLVFIFAHLFASLHLSNRPILLAMFGSGKVAKSWAEDHMPKYIHERRTP